MTLPTAIIVDIDGTLAIRGDRDPYDMTLVDEDEPSWPIIKLVRMLDPHIDQVFFVSGRDESARKATATWLFWHAGFDRPLLMRPIGDGTQDAELKRRIYREKIKGQFDVQYVIDDRNQCVKMWREEGLTCLQIADGAF